MMPSLWMIFAALCVCVSAAQAEEIVFDTDQREINVASNFHGENLVVFGNRPGPGDLAVVVEGPHKEVVVRKKGRVMGAWLNKNSVTFKNIPVFYNYAATTNVMETYDPAVLSPSSSEKRSSKEYKDFYEALVRTREDHNLYSMAGQEVEVFEDGSLFRADFKIPSNVPVGDYTVSVYYHGEGGVLVEKHPLTIAQIGVNASILKFSQYNSFLYGLSCVSFAMFAGWFSDKIRRRR